MKLQSKHAAGLLAALGLVAAAGVANAAIVTATYTGHLTFGYDQTGVFGAADTILTGAAFVAEYQFDTSHGQQSATPGTQYAIGGVGPGAPTPALGSRITINGHSMLIFGDQYAEVYLGESNVSGFDTTIFSQQNHKLTGLYNEVDTSYIEVDTNALGIPTNFVTPFIYDLTADDAGLGQLGINHYDVNLGSLASAEASFKAEHVQFTLGAVPFPGSAVPEPATWVMMIAGFGMAGAALRRRRVVVA